ncbi:alkaline phosphatase [Ichthyobacterium seriolicida]|uniref:Alkaline phosphatase n=2 Tax=Ichthyobacterium seriolicida TaxID=242600 RepID=A0A1J1DW23_9FLAO|nr:alkaline phosphatase [Ichthyobacterium seriolicida]
MIGDGMGLAQIFSGITANKGHLNIEKTTHIGFSKTHSSSHYITDSAAAGTAISTGKKTYNKAIGVDDDKNKIKTILEIANENGLGTGLVSTSTIVHATPASFISHQPNREMYEEIAKDFLDTDINVVIGGGRDSFNKRKDDINLLEKFRKKGYEVVETQKDMESVNSGRLLALLSPGHMDRYSKRGDVLVNSSLKAIELLNKEEKGFFLMIEGAQIDWGGHSNDISLVVEEMLDFDRAIGEVLKFAEKDKNTLVIITADHETGGLSIHDGDHDGRLESTFASKEHTSIMVPVFAYGPKSEVFKGFYQNTEIFKKMIEAYGDLK